MTSKVSLRDKPLPVSSPGPTHVSRPPSLSLILYSPLTEALHLHYETKTVHLQESTQKKRWLDRDPRAELWFCIFPFKQKKNSLNRNALITVAEHQQLGHVHWKTLFSVQRSKQKACTSKNLNLGAGQKIVQDVIFSKHQFSFGFGHLCTLNWRFLEHWH